jgi:hypothetical protein
MITNSDLRINANILELTNVQNNRTGVALFDSITGYGGFDYIPSDGENVIVRAFVDDSYEVNGFRKDLNNKVYYLVSNEEYTEADRDVILSLATPITMTLSSTYYDGSFTFSNPNDYQNLYIIFDYVCKIDSASFITYDGGASGVVKTIDVEFEDSVGVTGISYNISSTFPPSRFILEYNGSVVGDSGYVGKNSLTNYNNLIAVGVNPDDINLVYPYDGLVNNGIGSIEFKKISSSLNEGRVIAYSPLANSKWKLQRVAISLTSFYICTDNGSIGDVCSQIADIEMFHNGTASLPSAGDVIYTDSSGTEVYDGGNYLHLVSTTLMTIPAVSGAEYVSVNKNGVSSSLTGCDCVETLVPVITQDDINIVQGQYINLSLYADNNPTLWSVVTSCLKYDVTGGTKGTIYSYTDCETSLTTRRTVSVGEITTICSTTTPTVIIGDGVATEIDVCITNELPNGLSFDYSTGILSGIPTEACEYSIELVATNCVGDSDPYTLNISVESGIRLVPFAMDVENISADGADACVISPIYTLMYHNGVNDLPVLHDDIYIDHKGIELFMGGSRWYNIDGSTYSIKICETGKVCDTHVC